MTKSPGTRRVSAVIMVTLGAILMFLAPETWPGALLLSLGVVLELAGITLERKAKKFPNGCTDKTPPTRPDR